MTAAAATTSNAEQPAPHRGRVSLLALWTGLAAAPAAWTAQLLGFVLTAGLLPRDVPLDAPIWNGLRAGLMAISAAAIVIAVASMALSYLSWTRTRGERPGSGHQLISGGDGRTRFLSMCGLLVSALFLVAIGFETLPLLLSPLCRG
jgi:hypothetical protein